MAHVQQIILNCKKVKFYVSYDEDAFFEWLKKIECIVDIVGKGDVIQLCVDPGKIDDKEFRGLIGIFRRYKINLKQLEQLITEKNKEIFEWGKKGFSINVYPSK